MERIVPAMAFATSYQNNPTWWTIRELVDATLLPWATVAKGIERWVESGIVLMSATPQQVFPSLRQSYLYRIGPAGAGWLAAWIAQGKIEPPEGLEVVDCVRWLRDEVDRARKAAKTEAHDPQNAGQSAPEPRPAPTPPPRSRKAQQNGVQAPRFLPAVPSSYRRGEDA